MKVSHFSFPTQGIRAILVSSLLVYGGCATTLPPEPPPARVQVQIDNGLGMGLSRKFESQIKILNHIEISIFLRQIAEKLIQEAPPIEQSPVGIFVYDPKSPTFRNYSLPGVRIYASKFFIKVTKNDNEIASAIALEIAHVQLRHAVRDYVEGKPVQFFGGQSIFEFNEAQNLAATRSAVQILYKAGYDPRGLISLWKTHRENQSNSPYSPELLKKLETATYSEIATFRPLMNPIVRTERFLELQKRIKKL